MTNSFSHQCALYLLQCYPRVWRERYADEATAILEERPVTFFTLFDLFLGMLDAHLHTDLLTERKFRMLQCLRNSQITIFCSSIFFAMCWFIYTCLSLNIPGESNLWKLPSWYYPTYTPNYDVTFTVISIAGFLAIVCSLIGAIAFVRVTLRQAHANGYTSFSKLFKNWLLGSLAFAVLCVFVFGLGDVQKIAFLVFSTMSSIEVLFYIGSPFFHTPVVFLNACTFLVLFVWVTVVGPLRLIQGAKWVEFTPHFMRYTLILSALATLGMLVILVMMLVQATVLYVVAPEARLMRITALHLLIIGVALPTILSCMALWRGFNAQRAIVLS